MALNFQDILTNLIIEDSRYDVLMKKYAEPKKKGKKAAMDKDHLIDLICPYILSLGQLLCD